MALISSSNLIRILNIFHLTVAYFLLTSPAILLQQSLVMVLGGSMRIPRAAPFQISNNRSLTPLSSDPLSSPNSASSLAAVFLAFLFLTDTTAAFLSEPAFLEYWSTQSIARVAFLFLLESWIYLTKPSMGQMGEAAAAASEKGIGWYLKNDVVFTWGFVEFLWTFWIFLSLRDERRQVAAVRARERGREEGIYT